MQTGRKKSKEDARPGLYHRRALMDQNEWARTFPKLISTATIDNSGILDPQIAAER